MKLFEETYDHEKNLLPYDGTVNYYGKIFTDKEADFYLNYLLKNIEWQNDQALIFGKLLTTKRKVAWYGEQAFEYTYSKITKKALTFTPELKKLKKIIELHTGETYNSCLLNLYHNGSEGMAWHSDEEIDLKKHGAIASVSFGAERKFAFKHKATKETIALNLVHGSILVMKGLTQDYWFHRLPLTTKVNTMRVNLTFRTIVR
ncbi:alpha-ketoglutarate-dependent dioxygenase AlkB family protein [Pedobacter sp.]|uniref:alpha-ketoglutarate-dependent dioxygenase AlkB family protein n=1 Tax=Pedobacter sp. TaxID=1411316 RepID=UPI00396CB06D